MARLNYESDISIGKKSIKVDEFLKTLIYLPAEEVRTYFTELGLTLPRELRMFALRETLRVRVIETRKTRLTLADELNYRLSWFTEFTETQLENLLVFFDDRELDKQFLNEFWLEVLNYMLSKGVLPESFHQLHERSLAHVKENGIVLPDMKTYNRTIKDLFFDSMGRIDGLTQQKIRPVLYKSSTLGELRDLGSKYDVDVPRRLKKNELADIIIKELKERNQYTDALEKEIRKMSVIVLQRYAIDHDIKASTELKKEEIIEYILKNAKETKEAYFVPHSIEVYEKEVTDVSDEPIEDITEEESTEEEVAVEETVEETPTETETPTEEDTEEEVEEEEVVESEPDIDEPIEEVETKVEAKEEVQPAPAPVQQVMQTVDISELVEEIRKLREAVEKVSARVEEEPKQQQASIQELPEQLPEAREPIVLNSADFYGKPKSFKKVLKKEEIEERERFVEQQKAEHNEAKGNTDVISDRPGEVKFLIAFGKLLLRVFKVILKYGLILLAIGIVLLFAYGILTRLVALDFLNGFSNTLNGIQIAGKGILDHVYDLLAMLGI